MSNWGSLICNKVKIHVVAEKSVNAYKCNILIWIWLVNSINFEAFFRDWAWVNLMIRKVLIVTRSCENKLCVYFLFYFILNKWSDVFDSFRGFLPFIMSWIISSYNNDINFINVFLNIIKCFIKQFNWSVAFDTSKLFCLNWLSLRESILKMATNWQVTDCWGFLSVIQIQMNIC